MRCFVALDLPAPVRNHLANVTTALHGRFQVKWVRPEHMHVTLLFAGDLADDDVDALLDAVDAIDTEPLSLQLQRFGQFPPKAIPRVLWAGLAGDVDALTTLHEHCQAIGERLGCEADRRAFTPHVTVGRVTGNFGALALLDELRRLGDSLRTKPFPATALTVYSSELRPTGPIYRPLLERPLPLA